jgi:hypothetical protein
MFGLSPSLTTAPPAPMPSAGEYPGPWVSWLHPVGVKSRAVSLSTPSIDAVAAELAALAGPLRAAADRAALGRRDDPVLRAATFVGAASVLLALIGFLRWVFVVPALAGGYVDGDPTTKAAFAAAWTAQHQFGGALLGEHLGQLLAIGWSVTVSVLVLCTGMLARWVGWAGLVASCSTRATSWPPPCPASRSSTWPASSAARCGPCG